MKKKKRFYNNKNRNQKWTEVPVGRKIQFADKYITDEEKNYKYDKNQKKQSKPRFTKENFERFSKGFIIAVLCVLLVGAGYTVMDIHMELNSMPIADDRDNRNAAALRDIAITVKGAECQPLSLDAGVMQNTVIENLNKAGYSSVMFDLKRNDGTLGYISSLATADAYGGILSPSSAIAEAVKMFGDNDIIPVGRISCYMDNVAPNADLSAAVTVNGKLYKDTVGNTYINPDSANGYSYIKSIIEESIGNGITVFLLDNYDLPEELTDNYNDGFEALSARLYKDFGDNVKFLQAVDINIASNSAKAAEQEWKEKTEKINISDSNAVFCITAKNINAAKNIAEKSDAVNYIIFE
ncbi:MAG: hypothetical protein NC397_03295 [Clostridium sp.]|nr:hypothetical protein [Clostridium sp.]